MIRIAYLCLALFVIIVGCGNAESTEDLCAGQERCPDGMAFISAGDFFMGWEVDESIPMADVCGGSAAPLHEVHLDEYCIDLYETTNQEYSECVDAGQCSISDTEYPPDYDIYFGISGYEDYPMVGVTWEQAEEYCEWREKRLPTEAQWEKAARGPAPDQRLYPWGTEPEEPYAENIPAQIHGLSGEIGRFFEGMSPYCLYDMSGSAPEYVSDWYSDDYYYTSPSENPTGPDDGEIHVIRGGTNCAPWLSVALPVAYMLVNRYDCPEQKMVGIRCAASAL